MKHDDYSGKGKHKRTRKSRGTPEKRPAGEVIVERTFGVEDLIPKLSPDELLRLAAAHHNRAKEARFMRENIGISVLEGDFERLVGSEPDMTTEGSGYERESYVGVLRRICVNYLRHIETPYDGLAFASKGCVDGSVVFVKVKLRILAAIAEKYPFLSATCERLSERTKVLEKERRARRMNEFAPRNLDGETVFPDEGIARAV